MSHPMAFIEGSPQNVFIRGYSNPIVTPRGEPVPPQEVVARLQRYNQLRGTRYSIRWVPSAWGTSYYGLFEQWAERDQRRERIQRGELDPGRDFDLVTMFPPEVQPAEMMAWLENKFGRLSDDPVGEAQRRVEQAQKDLQDAQNSQVDLVMQTGEDRYRSETDHDRRVRAGLDGPSPQVSVAWEPKRLVPKVPAMSESVGE